MFQSRARQSGAAQRRPATTQLTAEIPTYEPPLHSLTPLGQNTLASLKRSHHLDNLQKSFKDANSALSECANEIQIALSDREASVQRQREAAEKKREEVDPQTEKDLEDLREKVRKMTERMEENVRKTIDGQQAVQDMEAALAVAQRNAGRANAGSTQRTQQQSFDPTLPGASESTAGGTQSGPSASNVFKQQVETMKTQYQALSMHSRYAEHNDYIGFKRSVHDGMHPDGDVPLAAASKWFKDGRGSPAPGTAATIGAEESDSDDDIAIAREKISTKCPLTLREFKNPVTSKLCPHTFEKDAIMELIGGPRRSVQCPVSGCRSELFQASLAQDQVLIRKIRRIQQSRNAAQNDPDSDMDDAPRGNNPAQSIILDQSSPGGRAHFDCMDQDDEVVPSTKPKVEPRSGWTPGPSQPPRSSMVVVVDLDDEDDSDED